MVYAEIENAIKNKNVVRFEYGGFIRLVEPHVLGTSGGSYQFLGFQIGGGSSSGGIPEWRRFDLTRIVELRPANDTFSGPRPTPSGRHSKWDQVFAIVR